MLKVILMIVIGQVTAFYIFNRRRATRGGGDEKIIFVRKKKCFGICAIKSWRKVFFRFFDSQHRLRCLFPLFPSFRLRQQLSCRILR
jgi:hypothetical protein